MVVEDIFRSIGFDRYDLNARLKPGLIVLLPIFATIAFWVPQVRTGLGATVSLLSACGLLYLLSQTVRAAGRAAERRMGDKAGRKHSARLLTHADSVIAAETKARYHAYLRSHGHVISTPDEERTSPETAFNRAGSAIDWLLEHTRAKSKKTLLYGELIAYGFQRNLYGMKPVALTVAVLAIAFNGALLWKRSLDEASIWTGILLEAGLVALIVWLTLFVTKTTVTDASFAYAQQLFNLCENEVPIATKRSRTKVVPPAAERSP